MVKIFCSLIATCLFVSCGNDSYEGQDGQQSGFSNGDTIVWPAGFPREGFLKPYEGHKYGFDISPNFPDKASSKEDSIAYVSIPANETGHVKVFTDSGYGVNYNYYYCDPNTLENLNFEHIPAETKREHDFEVSLTSKSIALCKAFIPSNAVPDFDMAYKIHELHAKVYDWKDDYNFYAYSWGDKDKKNDPRHGMINSEAFWKGFDTAYSQAIVKHGSITKAFREPYYWDIYDKNGKFIEKEEKKYILTRAKSNYDKSCSRGEIDMFMDSIELNGHLKNERRIIVQLGYPVRRFWPLRSIGNGSIDLCSSYSSYEDDPKSITSLRLIPIADKDRNNNECEATFDVPIAWHPLENAWFLYFEEYDYEEIATTDNVNPDCAAIVDTATADLVKYIEEISNGRGAETKAKGEVSVAILPWLENKTKRTAYHELGHLMGLTDINDAHLSNKITSNSVEGNLMHNNNDAVGFKLRNRGMVPIEDNEQRNCNERVGLYCVERQWDCLRDKNISACRAPTTDPYLR